MKYLFIRMRDYFLRFHCFLKGYRVKKARRQTKEGRGVVNYFQLNIIKEIYI